MGKLRGFSAGPLSDRAGNKLGMTSCRQEYQTAIEPWFLHQFVASPTQIDRKDIDNFEFENPNYCTASDPEDSKRSSVCAERLNAIDTELIGNETLSGSSADLVSSFSNSTWVGQVKSRHRYAQLDTSDMGVPSVGPEESVYGEADNLTEELPLEEALEQRKLVFPQKFDSNQEKMLSPSSNGTFYRSETPVDYSAQDFRRNFAVIDQAARQGALQQGGVKVRKEGDTTIVTEHRDPYSFYWQLDQVRKQEQPPSPREDNSQFRENVIEEIVVQSPDSHDSGIQVEYSKPSKPVRKLSERFREVSPAADESPKKKLPPGWERHEDPSGYCYYWHVDSGTVQMEPPTPVSLRPESPVYRPEPPPAKEKTVQVDRSPVLVERSAATVDPPAVVYQPQQPVIVERAFKQTTTKRRVENESSTDDREEADGGPGKPVRFAVRSLGWTEISEEELTPERSSRAVNKAIIDLSTGRNDFIDNVAKWGDGKELIMELDDHDLRLIDPDTVNVLHTQPIHQIRVWGVGRDNGRERDFAYVARDRSTRRFMCHVFRCDTPARTIANTLRDICKRLMMERRPNTLQTSTSATNEPLSTRRTATDPNRPTDRRRASRESSFPTPMEEPKKVIRCHFLGVTQVPRATGIDILNEAVDRLVGQVRTERWILVDVSIAPSTITINEVGGNQIAECRVRYLSFLGIGRDVKHCAFIMHTSSENFMCYVFHVEPSAGAMAKTIEAACKLRYQKVLDAHGNHQNNANGKGWGDTIRDVFGSLTGRRSTRNSHQHYPR